ncbi:MAG: diaminopimelate epimerase [Acutalibacteraceae bacterium]
MKLQFTKMHGCGNDYIYFNCMDKELDNPEQLSIMLSDRHFSIGGDGIIMICHSDKADARMRMFNADGSEGKMCGNATRCIGKYLYDNGIVKKDKISLETLSGIKYLDLTVENGKVKLVSVDMGKAILVPNEIPVALSGDIAVNVPHSVDGKDYNITCVSMGNPHCVVFGGDPDEIELEKIGPKFENDPIFPERVNTEFAQIIDEHTIKMRVWERGSGETLACGTGACATAVAAVLCGYCKKGEDITLKLRGGELIINYTDERVLMTGPAAVSFTGEVEV